jgi:hypothetical protein
MSKFFPGVDYPDGSVVEVFARPVAFEVEGADVFVLGDEELLGSTQGFDIPASVAHENEPYPVSKLLHHGECPQSLIGGGIAAPGVGSSD